MLSMNTSSFPPDDRRAMAASPGPNRVIISLPDKLFRTGFVLFMLAVLGLMMWAVSSDSIKNIRSARRGSPPIEQLQRVEGAVVGWVHCTKYSKFSWKERVSLHSDSGTIDEMMPCVLPAGALSDGKVHRIEILKRADDGSIYNIGLDGKTLLAYEDVKRFADDPARHIKFAAFMLTTLGIVFIGLVWAVITIWRS